MKPATNKEKWTKMKKRIVFKDGDDKGSTTAYVMWFHNAMNQRRQIAFDGVRWFYQNNTRYPFEIVSGNSVSQNVKDDMLQLMNKGH